MPSDVHISSLIPMGLVVEDIALVEGAIMVTARVRAGVDRCQEPYTKNAPGGSSGTSSGFRRDVISRAGGGVT